MHNFMGLFHRNDFRSQCVFRDLASTFGESTFFIVWDEPEPREADAVTRYQHLCLRPIPKEDLFTFAAQSYEADRDSLARDCRAFPLLLRILLAMYLRKRVGLEYCIMADNDIFIYEPIPEIVDLSTARVPFLIQETGAADTLFQINEYITRQLKKRIRYVPPNKGKGYNAGFIGLDLAVFDDFDPDSVRVLLDTLRPMGEWWREQAFFVSMTFTSAKTVHTFPDERYMFLPHDAPSYRRNSKIYHCIFTTDKRRVDLHHLLRYGRTSSERLRTCVVFCGVVIQSLRKRLKIRTRLYRLLGLSTSAE